MSPSHPPHGPQFEAPPQQPQVGQPGPPSLYRTQPGPYPQQPVAAPKPPEKKGVWLRRAALVVPALLVGACTGAIGASGEGSGTAGVPAGAPTATVTATSTVTAAAPARKPAPTVTVTAKAKDPAPAPTVTVTAQAQAPKPAPAPKATKAPAERSGLTAEQQQAVGAAEDYLDFTAFSRKGLIEQLSSDAGSGFSKKDATIAVDSMDIDYNEQAVKAAKSYLEFTHFSRKGLIEQLESDAGSGFTHSQAVYGASHAR